MNDELNRWFHRTLNLIPCNELSTKRSAQMRKRNVHFFSFQSYGCNLCQKMICFPRFMFRNVIYTNYQKYWFPCANIKIELRCCVAEKWDLFSDYEFFTFSRTSGNCQKNRKDIAYWTVNIFWKKKEFRS